MDDAQLGEPLVADFEVEQVLRDDADHRAARRQDAVRHDTHQADIPASVDEAPALCCEKASQPGRRLPVGAVDARTRPAEDTDALMHLWNQRAFFFTAFFFAALSRTSCTLNLTMRVISASGMRLSTGNLT
jgi:hypothetical protein